MEVVSLSIGAFMLVSMWRVFVKAGQPGWTALLPVFNLYVMLKIIDKPGWWIILMLVPGVNVVIVIIADLALASHFGKGVDFAVGLVFLPFIFWPILAFGRARYVGDPVVIPY